MKKKFKLFCFGFGQVSKYFVSNLIKNKFNFSLVTTNTSKTQVGKFNNLSYKSYYFKDGKFDKNLLKELKLANKILISIPPLRNNDLVLNKFGKIFKKNKFDWVTYLSATSVYGNKMGKWVNESTTTKPTSKRGIARLNSEKNWLRYFKDFNLALHIFRLSGIYSNENNALIRLKKRKLNIIEKKNQFFSRIHVEDIAKILTISLSKFNPGQIFNISDDRPCSNNELASYAARLLKMPPPKIIRLPDVKNKILKDFLRDSKKVSNKKMKKFFSYKLKYPDYKKGLRVIKNNIF
jgi:nucleoside-diphosphate-sugar epimerase